MLEVHVGTYRAEMVFNTGTLDNALTVYEGDNVLYRCRAQPGEGPADEEELLEWLERFLFDEELL